MAYLGKTVEPIHYFGASKETIQKAQSLRKKMTKAEKLMWDRLRRKQLKGKRFRRQHPINGYIVDFYCHESGLVIELDGKIHDYQIQNDNKRQKIIESYGLKVIRFRNEEIYRDINKIIDKIAEQL